MPAQVRQDDAIARRERFGNRKPEFMMDRKGMQKHHRRTIPKLPIENLCVAAGDLVSGQGRHKGD
jgi:hypothetical protein